MKKETAVLKKIEISHRTIIFTVSFLILLWLLYQIRQILVGLFISLVLMAALNPTVDRMERFKIPRAIGILLIYLLIFIVLGLVIAGIVPPLVDQTTTLISWLPQRIEDVGLPEIGQEVIKSQISQLGSLPANLLKFGLSLFTHLISIFAIFVINFYLLLERKNLNRYIHVLFSGDGEKKAEKLIHQVEKQMGGWVRAELILMVIIAIMSYLGLRLLGIDFALPLALLAGILEIVPNIGPTLSAIPAVLAGLVVSPLMALAVGALYFLIQQIENGVIVPQVMAQGVGVNPIITLVALAVGFKIGGVVGAVLAVPAVLLMRIIASELFSSGRFKNI